MQIGMEDEFWVMEKIRPMEWTMLVNLPGAADFTEYPKGKKRLFPDIVDDPEHEDIAADWKEFVQPEIESQFTHQLKTVSQDLESAGDSEADGEGLQRLPVPLSHGETWYSVLNQARLIMNEEYKISERERQLMSGELDPGDVEERMWLNMAQYRFYAAIQEFLLTEVMEL